MERHYDDNPGHGMHHRHIRHSDPCKNRCETAKEIDEILENIWKLREQGKISRPHYMESEKGKIVLEYLPHLCRENLAFEEEGHIKFTEKGEERARNIIRRHRLTERMLIDLFDIPSGNIEKTSCEFEHILSQEVTDSICSFLGHPTKCPHGKLIPPGDCCRRLETSVRPLVMPLSNLSPGEHGKINFITSKDKKRLQKLSSLGVVPGETVTLLQKLPVTVIQINQTEIALDQNIVSEIYVKHVS